MKFRVSIWCLFLITNSVSFVSCSKYDGGECMASTHERDDGTRWQREKKLIKKGLRVQNDNGELVELTGDDTPPPGSTRRMFSKKVDFYLYTRHNPTEGRQLTVNSGSANDLLSNYINKLNATYFITHGWLNSANSGSCVLIRDALLKDRDVNVIVVDWTSISFWMYGWAVEHVRFVGEKIAEMIKFLTANAHIDPDNITLIGHSLGAHVMGIAGHNTERIVKTIFGLDPAFPMFHLATQGSRLSSSDAKHVQVIHTNAGVLGFDEPIGTSDFYPDGGSSQKSCMFDWGGSCSHGRAYEFFAESINTLRGFFGRSCTSKSEFVSGNCHSAKFARMGGLEVDPELRGTYYLWTNRQSPYAVGVSGGETNDQAKN